jgi:hypothetical protein
VASSVLWLRELSKLIIRRSRRKSNMSPMAAAKSLLR